MTTAIRTMIFIGIYLILVPPSAFADAECPHCYHIASEAPWPENRVIDGRTLTFSMFQVTIPDGWDSLAILPEQTAVARYAEKYRIALALESYEQVPLGDARKSFEVAGYRMIDYPRLIYLERPSDDAGAVHQAARLEKRLRYQGMQNARVFRRNGVTAYVADIGVGDNTVDATVTFSSQPDFVVRILGSNLPSGVIEAIIGSVEVKEAH
ncbi:hypothetical protein [Thioalkalivibrio denitrificans]|nr:hypothetical protein [Thioalkalivibrio denitrificans]